VEPGEGPDAVETALRALLAEEPGALVAAVDERAQLIVVPKAYSRSPEPPSEDSTINDARSALELIAPEERVKVIQAWGRAREDGTSFADVRTADESSGTATLYFFDMRAQHDAMIAVLVPHGKIGGLLTSVATAPYMPKISRHRKSESGIVLEIDDATTQILGWTSEQMVGQSSLVLVHPDDHERALGSWLEMMAKPGSTVRSRVRYQHADGRWIWLELTNTNLVDDPAVGAVLCECLDLTDEMAAHEALRAREELLDRIAETIPLGLLQYDHERRIVYANERVAQICTGGAGSPSGDPFARMLPGDRELLDELLTATMRDGLGRDLEVRIEYVPGASRRCSINIRALSGEGGAVNGAILCIDDITESARMRAELEDRATFDALTQCMNRASIMEELGALLDRGVELGVVFVDLDGFKKVNDQYGHVVGDGVLLEAASRLRSALRGGDLIGRVGGDEFLVVCPGLHELNAVVSVANRISQTLLRDIEVDDTRVRLKASTGVAMADPGVDIDALVASADRAMYASKRQGRGKPVAAESIVPAAAIELPTTR
jgi:diguanylate cyclase (GGDEF)-like protein/PAS domain S-box-containing protein